VIRDPFYDPTKSYYENYELGPFGAFATTEMIIPQGAPEHEFFGQKIHAPFGIPAGPLLNAKFVKAALDKGFSLPIYKTVRSGEHESHQYPNVVPIDIASDLTIKIANEGVVSKAAYTEPLSITNSFGVPSFSPAVWQSDVKEAIAYAKVGQMVGVSFQGTKAHNGSPQAYIADWVRTAELVAETKPGFMEANLSCPNEGTTALLCFDIDRVEQIVVDIKSAVPNIPLWLKISYFEDEALLAELVQRVGPLVEGFATINTISAIVRTPSGEPALPGAGRLRSGVCGQAIKWAGIEMVRRFVSLRQQYNFSYTVIGVGGVMNKNDYQDYRTAGADVVMSATGAMWNPYLARDILSLSKK